MAGENKRNDDEAVGYGRPPKASQFKKGQSGNPFGRRKKPSGRRAIAERVFGQIQRLSGQPNGARVRYATLELLVMTLKQSAAAGHAQATALYTRVAERHGKQDAPQQPIGFIVLPERLTKEQWVSKYSPKDDPSDWPQGRV